jgi:hypothetical protein
MLLVVRRGLLVGQWERLSVLLQQTTNLSAIGQVYQ